MEKLTVDVNDLIAAYKQRCLMLMEECAMQSAIISGLEKEKKSLSDKLEEKCQPQS